ncbi:MAG: NAD(P)/FAD-dependent oxidoreductase [Magnetococcales bacterium]|nr:NAD(P)/FAD-dependent oxidoreductase [Magnetococcales bacterium]
MTRPPDWDVIILGAGASGLMCAATAGRRGRRVLVVDHARRMGEKVRVSGGGRCNFTHRAARPDHYLATDPDFPRLALQAFTPKDFIHLLDRHGIRHQEKEPGQLFCAGSAEQVVSMLQDECRRSGVNILAGQKIHRVDAEQHRFAVTTDQGRWQSAALVVALGGRSMPKLGATTLGYDLARQFGLKIVPPRPGLVPLTFGGEMLAQCRAWTGISLKATVSCSQARFTDELLFTHRGLSGPVILQISSYWRPGEPLTLDLAPGIELFARLRQAKEEESGLHLRTVLSRFLPRKLATEWLVTQGGEGRMAEIADKRLRLLADGLHQWRVTPLGTSGFERAEVTVGGVDTNALDPCTMACRTVPGLFFVGEVLDVTGWLGGFNLQWAWSSGHAAGLAV